MLFKLPPFCCRHWIMIYIQGQFQVKSNHLKQSADYIVPDGNLLTHF